MADPVSLEQRFADLTKSFLEAGRTDAGLPASSALPFRTGFQSGERKKPLVAFHCEQFEAKSNRRLIILPVHVSIFVDHTRTSESTERAWARKIRGRLADIAAWRDFLASLSEEDRTGYRILRLQVNSCSTGFDRESEERENTAVLTFHIYTDELLALPS